jgi:hypothetical protein
MTANVPIIVIGQGDPQCVCDHTRSLHLVTAGFCLASGQAGQACCCIEFQQYPRSMFPLAESR